ncbi:MAG TPA: TerD family protein [Yinghuangia sp.]|nr:TerD family protein [Yinghuangia sp.]
MRTFAMGEKARLADLTAATALRVEIAGAATGTDTAAFCFALDADGHIDANRPPVSADRPASLVSAVALVSGGASNASFDVDLDAVAPDVHRLLFVVASVGPDIALDAGSVVLTAGEEAIGAFLMDPSEMKGQRALILGEIYRRDGWRFGAVGQGYRDGLEQLVRDYGADPAVLLGGRAANDDGDRDSDSDAEPVSGSEEEAAVAVEGRPDADAEAERDAAPEPEAVDGGAAGTVPETEIHAETDVRAETETQVETDVRAETEIKYETGADAAGGGTDAATESGAGESAVPGVHTYEGSGDRILRISRPVESGPVVVEITGDGTANFAVWTLNSSLEHDKLLVNEIGAYRGRVLVDERGTATERLKIESDGPWTVVIQPPTAAPWLTGPVSGDGPEVLRWTGPRTVVAMTHAGTSNFMVRAYAESPGQAEDPYLASLANAIGSYDGESIIPAGPCLIEIEADGEWTFTPEPG